jgi:hypothetical protein
MRSIARDARPEVERWLARGVAVLLALLVCFPLLGPGYTLSYDMVFVPDPALNGRTLGLDGSVPRAVPMDFLIALLSHVAPVSLLQQAALLFCVGGAALGAWRLSPARTLPGAAAAATAYAWSVYVAERLVMGHWSLLLGYALLPWIVRACVVAAREPARIPRAVVLLAAAGAAAAPTSGVLTGLLVLALAWLLPLDNRVRVAVSGAVVVFNLVWALPGALAAGALDRTSAGVLGFAVSADTPLGGALSALTGGGVWNTLTHPTTRTANPVSAVITLAVVAVAILGLMTLSREPGRESGHESGRESGRVSRGVLSALLGLGLLGLMLAVGSTTEPGRDALAAVVAHVPGGGILRDAQKWLAWWLLLIAYAVGPGLERLVRAFPAPQAAFLITAGALLPLIALPDLAAGVGGRLDRTDYPDEYAVVARLLDEQPDRGALVVVPWHAFRAWSWDDRRTVLDPWTRMVDRRVVARDDLELTSGVVAGEDPVAAKVGDLLANREFDDVHLRALGIRYVLVDRSTAGIPAPQVNGTILHDGPLLKLTGLGPVTVDPDRPHGTGWLVAVDLVAAGILTLMLAEFTLAAARRLIRFRPSASQGGSSNR